MSFDNDMKIAGDRPSVDVRRNKMRADGSLLDRAAAEKAKVAGRAVAKRFLQEANAQSEGFRDYGLIIQRRLLLSFVATVCMENGFESDALGGIAQKAFLDEVKKADRELYRTSSDMGAFSFYYLAFRRGTEVERRIGQTFAMLCSHDGDPIFQELGEAIYCWFSSVVKSTIAENI